jgi:hypothetical protein
MIVPSSLAETVASRTTRFALGLALLLTGATSATASTKLSELDQALALVPSDAIAFVLVPSPKRASDDLEQCIERMNRPEAALGGRPIDQLKARFGVSASFDDKGPVALSVRAPVAEGREPRMVLSLPTTDPKAFVAGNLRPAPDIAPDAYRTSDDLVVYATLGAAHVHLSTDPEAVRGFDAGAGIAEPIRARLGARGAALLEKGDILTWAGRDAIRAATASASEEAARQTPSDAPFAAQAKEMQATATRLLEGLENGLVVVDIDPLGLGLRSYATFAEGSELAGLAAGGKDRAGTFDRMPRSPFYAALRMDIDGLGGAAALERLLATVPGQPTLPAWLERSKSAIRSMQLAIYPSRMGLAVGGLLNDSALFLETDEADAVRDGIRDAILATKGESGGLRREPRWEADRTLKSGEVTDAFEIVETVIASKDTSPSDLSMQRIISQAIYGSRGFVGFVKRQRGGLVMTFSQRADVLERATKVTGGAPSLGGDAQLAAYREWLIDRPELGGADIEGFLGIGQFGKLLQQIASLIPGGEGIQLPQIPTSVEPVAAALEVDRGTVETAIVIPSGVLALGFDQIRRQLLGTGPAPAAGSNAPANSGGAGR